MAGRGPIEALAAPLVGRGPSPTMAIDERCKQLQAEGKAVTRLGLGQSPFPVPDILQQALRDHAHEKDYLPVAGLPELRSAIAAHHAGEGDAGAGPDDVLVGPGSKELMFLLQLVYDGLLMIPAPSWVSYEPQALMLGRRAQWIVTHRSDGWCVTPEAIDVLCRSEAERPRLLILNDPSNPSGASFEATTLEELAAVCRQHRILVLSDEIYGHLHHAGGHVSMARFYPEGTIVSSGLSKWCGAGGWRLGYFVFPPQLSWLRTAVTSAASETFTSVSAPIQYAAVPAFARFGDLSGYLGDSRRVLAALCRWITTKLSASQVACGNPEGGFYLFPDVAAARDSLAERGVRSSPGLCEQLLVDTGVATLPGSCFGRPANELTLRLAYVDFDGGAALAAASTVAGELDETFLRAHCPRVLAGIDAMCEWLR